MKNWQTSVLIVWLACLGLNIFSYVNSRVFEGAFTAVFWFFLSVLVLVSIYQNIYHPLFSRLLIVLVAFIGGLFTYFLYYGIIEQDAFYLGLMCAVIALSLTLGVGVLL